MLKGNGNSHPQNKEKSNTFIYPYPLLYLFPFSFLTIFLKEYFFNFLFSLTDTIIYHRILKENSSKK